MPKVDMAQFKNLDDLIFNILDDLGNKASALAIAAGVKTVNMTANGLDSVKTAAESPMRSDYVMPSSSPEISEGAKIDSPGRGKGITMGSPVSVGANTEMAAAKAMPSQQAIVAEVNEGALGQLAPSNIGTGQNQGQYQGR